MINQVYITQMRARIILELTVQNFNQGQLAVMMGCYPVQSSIASHEQSAGHALGYPSQVCLVQPLWLAMTHPLPTVPRYLVAAGVPLGSEGGDLVSK